MWRIGELLIQKKLITWDQLEDALAEQKKTKEFTGSILVRKGYIPIRLLYKTLAEQADMLFIDIKKTIINPKALEKIPYSIASKYQIIPIDLAAAALILGVSNPFHVWPQEDIRSLAGVSEIRTVLCLPNDVNEAIESTYAQIKPALA